MHTHGTTSWRSHFRRFASPMLAAALLAACTGDIGDPFEGSDQAEPGAPGAGPEGQVAGGGAADQPDQPPPPFVPGPPTLARLTQAQYANAIRDLFGGPAQDRELQADAQLYLFSVIGGANMSATELGVDLYGRAAYSIGADIFSNAARRQSLVSCAATGPLTDAC